MTDAQIAVRGFSGMQKHRGRAGALKSGRKLPSDVSRFSQPAYDHFPGMIQNQIHGLKKISIQPRRGDLDGLRFGLQNSPRRREHNIVIRHRRTITRHYHRIMNAFGRWATLVCGAAITLHAQIIPFESNGLKYKALTHGGMTIMFAQLPTHIRNYSILQVSVSNGSPISWTVRPEDFRFEGENGVSIQAPPARVVVGNLLAKASRGDVSKLVIAYETALYGNTQMHSTNGYETRRQDALAEGGSSKLKAAAAASAIALGTTKLQPGESTDGAVFYPTTNGKPLGAGKLIVEAAGEEFVFPVEPELQPHGGH